MSRRILATLLLDMKRADPKVGPNIIGFSLRNRNSLRYCFVNEE